jgi:hypothetical protein
MGVVPGRSTKSLGVISMKQWFAVAVLATCISPAFGQSAKAVRHTVTFTPAQSAAVGYVERLVVTVDCGWIDALRNIPELYNIEMGYEMPTQNILEARPRLGAGVPLAEWSGGITATGDPACFGVIVHAEGRNGELNLDTRRKRK